MRECCRSNPRAAILSRGRGVLVVAVAAQSRRARAKKKAAATKGSAAQVRGINGVQLGNAARRRCRITFWAQQPHTHPSCRRLL